LIGGSCVEIKTEADSNDITECPHDDKPTTGMFGLSDAIFSAFICLCMTPKPVHISFLCSTTFPYLSISLPLPINFADVLILSRRRTDRQNHRGR